ncbi:MAG TPA: iron-containing alcohol dehydrogenase, partial [Acetobacteraceae bacterium]|nr:iron-containing alcohol dehydrogenase [Acetobacteraceae bacterium]
LHVRFPHVGQGESTAVVHASRIRLAEQIDTASARQVAQALEVWRDGMSGLDAAGCVADRLEALYARAGMPTRLRQLDIPRDALPDIARDTVKNFNANAGLRTPQAQIDDALRLLQAAY